jgi:hypothetical protein
MKPRKPCLQLERAAAHLLRARTELVEAAHALQALGETNNDHVALAAEVAATQARLAEALAAAIHAPQHAALDDLLAALSGEGARSARMKRH